MSKLFINKTNLLLIHNMGIGCSWCTAWADGINGILQHLETHTSVVLVSKDDPVTQRKFALKRNWNFRLASHGGGEYMAHHCAAPKGEGNYPGAATYVKKDGKIFKKNQTQFGPGDQFNSIFPLSSLVGIGEDELQLK